MTKKVSYYGIHRRHESKNISGYINAPALNWDEKIWRFSTRTHLVNDARKIVHTVFKAAEKNPQNFDYKSFVKQLTSDNDSAPASNVYTVEVMIQDYLNKHKPSECEVCYKPFRKTKWLKFNTDKCEPCPHRKQKNTHNSIKTSVRHILAHLKDVPVQELSIKHLENYITVMRKKYADGTISTSYDFLKASINLALENEKIRYTGKITQVLKMKKNLRGKYKLKPNERKDDFTQDRVVKFLNTIPEAKKLCKDEGSKRLYDYLQTMIEIDFYYPARASELRKLKISQFEIRDDIGVLKFGKMKNGNEREIYIEQPELIEKLQSLKESSTSEWFFENPYKPGAVMTKEQFSYRFNKVRKLAKLSKNVVFQRLVEATI